MNRTIVVGLTLLFALGIFFGYVMPTWNGPIAKTKEAIISNDNALEAAKSFSKHETELANARKAMNDVDVSKLERLLPDSINTIGLILDLNALAATSGLTITAVDTTADKPASAGSDVVAFESQSPEDTLTVSLTAVGSYSAFKTFMKGVEMSTRLIDARDINIKGSDTGVYTYELKLRVYWLRS